MANEICGISQFRKSTYAHVIRFHPCLLQLLFTQACKINERIWNRRGATTESKFTRHGAHVKGILTLMVIDVRGIFANRDSRMRYRFFHDP